MADRMTDDRALAALKRAVSYLDGLNGVYAEAVAALDYIASRLQAQQPGEQAVVIPEPSDEDVEAAWVAFQANIPGNTMRALLSNDRARLRERIGQAPGGDGDA